MISLITTIYVIFLKANSVQNKSNLLPCDQIENKQYLVFSDICTQMYV